MKETCETCRFGCAGVRSATGVDESLRLCRRSKDIKNVDDHCDEYEAARRVESPGEPEQKDG